MRIIFLLSCYLAVLLLAAALAYWQLVIAEGAYLGPRIVRTLYDWTARRYDAIKCFDAGDEALFLGAPLARALTGMPAPLVLDVACGTGRLPKTLLGQAEFSGKVIGLDASRSMLAVAAYALGSSVPLIWQHAEHLPFAAHTFDAVTCLEALEFMPSTGRALGEITRVLRPGGILVTSNRIGNWARLMPGHTMDTQALGQHLADLGYEQIKRQAWQVEYDLIWARRSGDDQGGAPARGLAQLLVCPYCKNALARVACAWHCSECGRSYPVASDGVIEILGR